MIIKKANIISFAGIKNKVIEFKEGINIIYGLNESGKSSIQSFIKIWLYGFSNYRGKDINQNERLRYLPSDGQNISGELWVEFKGKEYIIIRSFGKSKREDTSKVINALTGEVNTEICSEQPGKYFLNINRSTFVKTLFIGQLDVEIRKDKEEEIIDKISSSIGVGKGEVAIDKAFLKLDNYKKRLTNNRKTGELDIAINKQGNLVNEKYSAYELSKSTLEKEELLINLKKEKEK